MSFAEVELLGVCISPISVMMASAWLILVSIRRAAGHARILHHVWHPALFECSMYVIVLSSIVLVVAN